MLIFLKIRNCVPRVEALAYLTLTHMAYAVKSIGPIVNTEGGPERDIRTHGLIDYLLF